MTDPAVRAPEETTAPVYGEFFEECQRKAESPRPLWRCSRCGFETADGEKISNVVDGVNYLTCPRCMAVGEFVDTESPRPEVGERQQGLGSATIGGLRTASQRLSPRPPEEETPTVEELERTLKYVIAQVGILRANAVASVEHTLRKREAHLRLLASRLPALLAADTMLESAWIIIANVGGSDWTTQSAEWQAAVAKWRDQYHERIIVAARSTPSPTTPTGET